MIVVLAHYRKQHLYYDMYFQNFQALKIKKIERRRNAALAKTKCFSI